MADQTKGIASLWDHALGVSATVVWDTEGGPRTVDEDVKRDYRDVGPGYLDDIDIVSTYSLHVALYALQNPTPENIAKALYKIGVSGDCEEWTDSETLLPLPVPVPSEWEREF